MQTLKSSMIILGVFLIANLAIGIYYAKRIKSIFDYCIGNRNWSVGALVMTYVATVIGGGYVFRIQFEAFNSGGSVMIGELGFVVFNLVVAFVFGSKMAKFKGCLTLGDMLGQLYGKYAQMFLGLISPIHGLVICGLDLASIGFILNRVLGIDGSASVVVSGIIVVAYTVMGGIRSVTATDVFQFIMLVLVISTITSLAIYEVGGTDVLLSKIPKPSLEMLHSDRFAYSISFFMVTGVFQSLINEPARVQRILMAGGSTNKIKKVFTYSAFIQLGLILVAVLMGLACVILYPNTKANEVVLTLIDNLSPTILKPILCVGLISVLMSTADSFLHSASVSFARDFVANLLPDSKKETSQVTLAMVSTALIGFCAINFGLWKGNIVSLSYMLGIMGPTITVPLVFGILGLKSSNRAFWLAALCGGAASLIGIFCELKGLIGIFSIPLSMLINCIVFIAVSCYDNKGLYLVKDPNSQQGSKLGITERFKLLFLSLEKAFIELFNPSGPSFSKRDTTYELFGICYCSALLFPYFLFAGIPLEYRTSILIIRGIAIALCTLLIARSRLPSSISKYIPLFWNITLLYCLPFMSTVLLLITNGSTECLINIAVTIMLLILLVDWSRAALISCVGTLIAIFTYEHVIKIEALHKHFSFNTIYLLVYQIIFGTIIGLLFARRKQQKVESIEEAREFATQRYDMAKERLYSKELTTASTMRDAMGDANMGIMKRLGHLRFAMDRLLKDTEGKADSWEVEGWLDELQQSILGVVFQGKKFLKLHVEDLNLNKLAADLAVLCRKEFEGTTIINLKAKSTNIQCDKEALFRILTRALHELKEDISLTGNTPSDTTITLEIADTTIKYIMSSRPNYEKDLPAIRFLLTPADTIDSSLLPAFYEKEIEDPFELKDYSGAAENVTVNNYIKAHYAVDITAPLEEGSTKTFAFPREIYEIRPEGFDKVYYEERKNFRSDPAALGLELYFLGEIRTIAKRTNHAKAQKAVDFIRKYHYNQTYRTGRPFYVHSIQSTRILLRFMKYQLDIAKSRDAPEIERDIFTGNRIKNTYLELQENQETLVLTSLLQHLIDRTAVSDSLIEAIFGYEIAIHLNALSKLCRSEVLHQLSQEELVKSITASRNPTLLCIKLADRLHDLHTIDYVQDVEERKRFAEETSRYFVEVANFLGFHTIERDIANACDHILIHGKIKGFEFRSEAMMFLIEELK